MFGNLVFLGHKQWKQKSCAKAISICISILISCLIMETFWSANVLTCGACEMRAASVYMGGGEVGQHCWDTIRLVPLHLMLLSWMQRAAHERLLFCRFFEKINKTWKWVVDHPKVTWVWCKRLRGWLKKTLKSLLMASKNRLEGQKSN